ncbi:MAG: hypothetical protein Q7R39_12815 [Dehalococcoidia bacterium]|nr:hypothetical protein [Dehalococcoidia bacterium]
MADDSGGYVVVPVEGGFKVSGAIQRVDPLIHLLQWLSQAGYQHPASGFTSLSQLR